MPLGHDKVEVEFFGTSTRFECRSGHMTFELLGNILEVCRQPRLGPMLRQGAKFVQLALDTSAQPLDQAC